MNDNREPVACPKCETVNPFMNEECRDCKTSLEGVVPLEPSGKIVEHEQVDESSDALQSSETQPPKSRPRRLNALWMIIGLALYVGLLTIGGQLIMSTMVSSNAERQQVLELLEKTGGEFPEEEKSKNIELFMPVILVAIALMLFTALLIGAVIGFFADSIREAAIAMGVTSVLVFLLNGGQGVMVLVVAVVAAALNAGLATIGAFGGRLLRRKFRGEG